MATRERGSVERIAIDIAYPGGERKHSVIEGPDLDGLAAIALQRSAIGELLKDEKARADALSLYDKGTPSGAGRPRMLLLYDDQTYTMKCAPSDHRPHNE